MPGEPQLVDRPERTYAALHRRVHGVDQFPAVIDAGFGELGGWLATRGLRPAGPALIRYRAEEGEDFVIDLGFPLEGDVGEGSDGVAIERLPAGRYAVLRHVGHFDGLAAAHAALDEWAARAGVAYDEHLGARVEHYLVDPSTEPDPSRWETEIEQLVARDGGAPGPR